MEFQAVEDELWEKLLPSFFNGITYQIPQMAITGLPVKQAGIALTDPTQTLGENWTESYVIIGHLVAALSGTAKSGQDTIPF